MSERSPELSEVLRVYADGAAAGIAVALPARVERYDTTRQEADCKPLVRRGTRATETGERIAESLPVIPSVPVLFPGAGGFRVTFPVGRGDLGLLIFCDLSIDRWLSGQGQEVDPEIDHSHSLTDAVFLPGLHPFGAPLGSAPTDRATLGLDDGMQIHFREDGIRIGSNANSDLEAAALADSLDQRLATIEGRINDLAGHVHLDGQRLVTSVPNKTPPPPPVPILPILAPPGVKSGSIKVKK